MPRGQMDPVLRFVRKLAAPKDAVHLEDRELLELFRNHNDQAAFAALVRRHGPMVLRLCQRVAQNEHDAEDVVHPLELLGRIGADMVAGPRDVGPKLSPFRRC